MATPCTARSQIVTFRKGDIEKLWWISFACACRDGAAMGWTEGEVSEVLGEEDLLFQSGSQSYQVRPQVLTSWPLGLFRARVVPNPPWMRKMKQGPFMGQGPVP